MSSVRSPAPSLSKIRRPVSKKVSPLLRGESICQQLRSSSFGGFHAAVHEIKSYLSMVAFKLPTVIVVGGRSAGKSSLLENITKCPVFPRDPALCTKMPVKLQLIQVAKESDCSVTIGWRGSLYPLQSKDDILQEVAKIMDSVDGIVTDELTVAICQVDVPTFELIDLPGIQEFPEEQQRCTRDLVSNYLNKPDTLVLCVVDATIPSLDSSPALGMVRATDKLPNTILALTKSDLVRSEFEIVERIFDRVLGTSSEHQHLVGLAGCVAVANRNHTDHLSLVEADVEERCCFQAMLDDPAEAYAPAEVQQKLRNNMTIKKLILKLDSLFHNFIVQRWKPAALTFLAPLKEHAQDEIQRLGPSVEALTKDGVMEAILTQVNYEEICVSLHATSIQVTKSSHLLSLTTHMTYHPWGSLAWAESVTKVEEKVTKAVKAALAGDKYDRPVLDAFNAVFEKSTLTPLKLKRFGSLKALLLSDLLPKRIAEAKKAAAPVIYDMLQKALVQLNYDTALGSTFQQLDVGIRGCIIKYLIAHLKNRPLSLPDSFQLAEDDKVKKKRSRLTDKLTQIVTATDKIVHIEEAISVGSDTDFGPSLSSALEIPDFSEFTQEPYQQVVDTPATEAVASSAAPMPDELQMHAVPQESERLLSLPNCGPGTTSASSHSTPIPVSVAAQVNSTAAASGPSDTDAGLGADTSAISGSQAVFCKNLPGSLADEDLIGFFADCGFDRMVNMGKGFSVIHFDSPEGAAKALAMSGQVFHGHNIVVIPVPSVPPRHRTVFCNNVSWDATEEEVSGFFHGCGKVVDCHLAFDETSGRRIAHVQFDTLEGAANALTMNGQDFGGQNMLISLLSEVPEAQEVPITNSNLACSMAQLGSLQLDPPGSAAGIEAETETVPLSPSASVAPSITESFFVVE